MVFAGRLLWAVSVLVKRAALLFQDLLNASAVFLKILSFASNFWHPRL